MRFGLLACVCIGMLTWQTATARQRGQQQQQLMECGVHGDFEILCGTRSPEDLELTPDGKFLIVSQFVNGRGANNSDAGLVLLDLAAKTYRRMPMASERRNDWGDAACPGPIGDAIVPHGISLAKRANGMNELYVVN